jgi:hypothetical protein
MGEIRLGDIIDDFCVKCKRIMNHAVVSMLNGEPAKVRCRTCHNDHDYRHEQAPPPKVDARKQALFNEVLAKVAPGSVGAPAVPDPVLEDPPEEIPPELEEAPLVEEAKPQKTKAAVKTTAKAKAKAKGHK